MLRNAPIEVVSSHAPCWLSTRMKSKPSGDRSSAARYEPKIDLCAKCWLAPEHLLLCGVDCHVRSPYGLWLMPIRLVLCAVPARE